MIPFASPSVAVIHARPAQVIRVVLPSHAAGGYLWQLQAGYDRQVATPMSRGWGEAPAGHRVGPLAPEIFRFRAIAPGTTTLRFLDYRPWEGPKAAVAEADRRLIVTP